MKLSFAALAATLVAVVNAAAVPDSNLVPRQTAALNALTDQLLFSTSMSAFTTRRNAKNPSTLDWNSDGCSASPDKPFGFNFLPSCHRHDFGYRNYKRQGRLTEANRKKIDDLFKKDLYAHCATKSVLEEAACKGIANIYYEAVREFGDGVWNVNLKKRDLGEIEA